jgi:hypothetical protein
VGVDHAAGRGDARSPSNGHARIPFFSGLDLVASAPFSATAHGLGLPVLPLSQRVALNLLTTRFRFSVQACQVAISSEESVARFGVAALRRVGFIAGKEAPRKSQERVGG